MIDRVTHFTLRGLHFERHHDLCTKVHKHEARILLTTELYDPFEFFLLCNQLRIT